MAFFVAALLISLAINQVYSLECLVIDPTINYYGFVSDPSWTYCTYDPMPHTQHYQSTGINDVNDAMSVYKTIFEDVRIGGSRVKVPHLCFDEEYTLSHRNGGTMHRCLCDEDRCNVRGEYPWWLVTFGEDNLVLNDTISHHELKRRIYEDSIRHYKFLH